MLMGFKLDILWDSAKKTRVLCCFIQNWYKADWLKGQGAGLGGHRGSLSLFHVPNSPVQEIVQHIYSFEFGYDGSPVGPERCP